MSNKNSDYFFTGVYLFWSYMYIYSISVLIRNTYLLIALLNTTFTRVLIYMYVIVSPLFMLCTYSFIYQMKIFSALLALCEGNPPVTDVYHRSPMDAPNKGQWHGALMFSLICACANGWANNRGAGDLRRHRAHDDVTVINTFFILLTLTIFTGQCLQISC